MELLHIRILLWLGLACVVSGAQHSSAELSPSDTRLTVQALLAGGLAKRAQQDAGEHTLKASKLVQIAHKRAKIARRAELEATLKQRSLQAAHKAERVEGAGMLLEVAQERGQQSVAQAKEGMLKHDLWAQLRAEQLTVLKLEQERMNQGHSLEAQLKQAGARVRELEAAHAKLSTRIEASTATELLRYKQLESAKHSAAQSSQLATAAAVEKEQASSSLEEPASVKISTDIWGAKKCQGWLAKEPAKCKAPNYKFNCAKTCAGLLKEAPAATPEKLSAASTKLKAALVDSKQGDTTLEARRHDEARAKQTAKGLTQEKLLSTVSARKARRQLSTLLKKTEEVKNGIAEASSAQLELKALCKMLQSVREAATTTLRAQLQSASKKATDANVLETKALKVGLMLLGDDGTATASEPAAASEAYMQALKHMQASSVKLLNQTSNRLLTDAHQVIHRAADSITALLATPSALKGVTVPSLEAARIEALRQDAQKASLDASAKLEQAKQAEAHARLSERKAARLKQKTRSVIDDQVLIDSSKQQQQRQSAQPGEANIEASVKKILESPSNRD